MNGLNNSRIIATIKQTTDFTDYKIPVGLQRKRNPQHIRTLIASFKEYGTARATVTVIKTSAFTDGREYELYVVDGQHTMEASKESGLPVNVEIIELANDTILMFTKYMSMLNSSAKAWTNETYLEAYANNGIEEYKKFDLYKKQYKLTMTDLMYIFLGGSSTNENKAFKSGEMKFNNEKESNELLKIVNEVRNFLPNKAYIRRAFYTFIRAEKENKLIKDAILTYTNTVFSENEALFKGDLKGLLLKYNRHLAMVAN